MINEMDERGSKQKSTVPRRKGVKERREEGQETEEWGGALPIPIHYILLPTAFLFGGSPHYCMIQLGVCARTLV